MKVAVIGGVGSTRLLVEKLSQHGFNDVHVWGYSPTDTSLVSGWSNLDEVCRRLGFEHTPFVQVVGCKDGLRAFAPDVLFAVGLSQIIPPDMLAIPTLGCIGFHPTALPKGRGRAAIAWLVLEHKDGAASFFSMRDGVDDGPILVQEPFKLGERDDAGIVEAKLLEAEAVALDRWLPQLAAGILNGVEQDHAQATWYARRAPDDGWIDWHRANADIDCLIRASTDPHPGAYTFQQDASITIWAAECESRPEQGVPGRILSVSEGQHFVVQCGEGLLRVTRWQADPGWMPRVGMKLGYYAEAEIRRLRQRCSELEGRLDKMEATIAALADSRQG